MCVCVKDKERQRGDEMVEMSEETQVTCRQCTYVSY